MPYHDASESTGRGSLTWWDAAIGLIAMLLLAPLIWRLAAIVRGFVGDLIGGPLP